MNAPLVTGVLSVIALSKRSFSRTLPTPPPLCSLSHSWLTFVDPRKAKETLCGELWDEEGGDFDDSFDPDPPPKSAIVALSGVTKTLWGSAFLALLQPLVPRFKTVITRALALAGLKESDVSAVILTGGSSRLPVLAPLLHDLFPGVSLKNDVNPFSCVAIGAALKGAVTSGRIEGWELDNALMSEILPHRMGVVGEEDTLITVCEAGSTLPCRCSAVFEVADVDQGGWCLRLGRMWGRRSRGWGNSGSCCGGSVESRSGKSKTRRGG